MDPVLSDPNIQIPSFLHDVDAIVALGGHVSDSFEKVRAGWKAATTDPTTAELEAKILAAISTGDAVVVEQAMTAARIGTISAAPIRGHLARVVQRGLRAAYAETGAGNYAVIAATFDEAADRLTKCAAAVDITLDADRVVGFDAKQRTAWMDSAVIAKELDGRFAALVGAAELAGIPTRAAAGGTLTGALIALACDPGTAHRRRTFEAWATRGRCGRWAGLLALGVTLKAADLAAFEAYREPRPLEVRQQRSGMGTRQYTVDPEDQDYQPLSTDHRTPAEIARAKASADAWSKLGKRKAPAATE